METSSTNRWLYWIIIFLIVTNLSTIVLMSQRKEPIPPGIRDRAPMEQGDEQLMSRALHRRLGLSDEQIEKVKPFTQEYREQVHEIKLALKEERVKMFDLLNANPVNDSELESATQRIGKLHTQLKQKTARYYLELKAELTPKQQEELAYMFDRMAQNQPFEPRSEGRFRHRRGRP